MEELTRADALMCAAVEWLFTAAAKGFDRVPESAGKTFMDFFGPYMALSPHGSAKGNDERNNRLSSLIIDVLREDREQMTELHVVGAFTLLMTLATSRPATAVSFE